MKLKIIASNSNVFPKIFLSLQQNMNIALYLTAKQMSMKYAMNTI